jgi:16S rRNA G966 N2-methylase RsmD
MKSSSYNKYKKYKNKYIKLKRDIDDFPYYKKYYEYANDNQKLRDRFFYLVNNLKSKVIKTQYIPNKIKNKNQIEKYKDNYVLFEENWNNTEELNHITNLFTEECRILCKFKQSITPLEYWQNNKKELENMKDLKSMNSEIYKSVEYCSNFRISVALIILKFFNTKKWLDISAGWGDRLVAAIGHKVDLYVGVDPNECLHPNYVTIINTFVDDKDKHKYVLIKDGFETAKLPDTKFDLVFSSPPFFDLEKYSQETNDSYNKFNREKSWYDNFLIPSLTKSYEYLEENGHLVLYIGEGIGTNYLKDMLEYMNKLMVYEGKLYYYYDDVHIAKRFYVWKKVN